MKEGLKTKGIFTPQIKPRKSTTKSKTTAKTGRNKSKSKNNKKALPDRCIFADLQEPFATFVNLRWDEDRLIVLMFDALLLLFDRHALLACLELHSLGNECHTTQSANSHTLSQTDLFIKSMKLKTSWDRMAMRRKQKLGEKTGKLHTQNDYWSYCY